MAATKRGRPRLVTITSVLPRRFRLARASSYALAFVTGTGNRRRVAHILHFADDHAVARIWTQALTVERFTAVWRETEDLARVLKDDVDVYLVPEDVPLSQVRWGMGCVHALHAEYRRPATKQAVAV